jgi:hypothetical protein
MNHDGHNACQHPNMAYCRMCDAAYCRACAREWPQRLWNWTYHPSWQYQGSPSIYPNFSAASDSTMTAQAVSCAHT